jgi:uncharacterized protein (DUF169 family)
MEIAGLLAALGYREEPLGFFYTERPPQEGNSPRPARLPSAAEEARGEVDFGQLFAGFSCVMGHVWRTRRQRRAAWFDREHFGCLGGAFYLGFLKPQLEIIARYVSTGIPGVLPGERYLPSPEVCRHFFETIDPPAATGRYAVFQPLSRFGPDEEPEVVIFFARPEVLTGLHMLATFVTGDFQVVQSPFGADCSQVVTWPRKFLAEGRLTAVLGGFDPSARRYHAPDELSFAMPWELFRRLAAHWRESFLTGETWERVRHKIRLIDKVWGEK